MATYGIVYILSGGSLGPGFYKVGKSTRDVHQRIRELNSETTNIAPFKCDGYVVVTDIDAVENTSHEKLAAFRINPKREFFKADLQNIVSVIREASEGVILEDKLPKVSDKFLEHDFNKIINDVIETKTQPPSNRNKEWRDEVSKLEEKASDFLIKISGNKNLSRLPLIDNIAHGRSSRLSIFETFANSANVKKDWGEEIKNKGHLLEEVQNARLLFAIGFEGEIINNDPRMKNKTGNKHQYIYPPEGVFYYITHEISWDTRYDDLPSGIIRLCPLSGYGKTNIFEKECIGGHGLKLSIDFGKGDHVLAVGKHLASNVNVKKVYTDSRSVSVIKQINYDDLLGLTGRNIGGLWKLWPKFQLMNSKRI